jgi:hypothetical protein
MSKFKRSKKTRVNPSGRESVGKHDDRSTAWHVPLHDWLIMSPRWKACTPMARAALLEFMACDWGGNNGMIAMGRRELAKRLGGRGIATADRAIACLRKNGLLVLTREGSKGPKGERAAEFLLPFRKDHRGAAKPTPLTAEWNKARKHNRNFAKLEVATMRTPAWRALSAQSRLLLMAMISKSKRRNPVEMSNDEAGKAIGASDDTARRAFNELQAKGFIELKVEGRALIGRKVSAVYTVDLLPVQGETPVPVPPARYRLWTPDSDFPVGTRCKKTSASDLMGFGLTSGSRGNPLGLTSGTREGVLGPKSASPAEHTYVPICPGAADQGTEAGNDGREEKSAGAPAIASDVVAADSVIVARLDQQACPAPATAPQPKLLSIDEPGTADCGSDVATNGGIDWGLDGGHRRYLLNDAPAADGDQCLRREAQRILYDLLPGFLPDSAYRRLRNVGVPDVEQAIRVEAKGQLRPQAVRAAGKRVLTRLIAIGKVLNHPDPCSAFLAGIGRRSP